MDENNEINENLGIFVYFAIFVYFVILFLVDTTYRIWY